MTAGTRIIGLRFALRVLAAIASPSARVSKFGPAARGRSTKSVAAGVTFHITICGFISGWGAHLALTGFLFDGRTEIWRNCPAWTETGSSRSRRSECRATPSLAALASPPHEGEINDCRKRRGGRSRRLCAKGSSPDRRDQPDVCAGHRDLRHVHHPSRVFIPRNKAIIEVRPLGHVLPGQQRINPRGDALNLEMACGVGLCSVIEGAVLPAFSRRDENRGRAHRWFPRRVSQHSFNSPRTGLQHDFDRWRRVAADIEAGIENAEAALPDIGDIEIRWHAGSHESSEVSGRNGRYHKGASLIVDKRSSRRQPLIHTGFRKSAVHLQPDAQCGTGRNAVYGHSSVDPYAGRNVERDTGHILIENIDLGVSESEARTTVGVLLRHPCPHIVGTGRNAADVEFPNKCVPLGAQHGGYCGCSKIVRRICVARTNRKKCIDGG